MSTSPSLRALRAQKRRHLPAGGAREPSPAPAASQEAATAPTGEDDGHGGDEWGRPTTVIGLPPIGWLVIAHDKPHLHHDTPHRGTDTEETQ